MDAFYVKHPHAVWRERADFVIRAAVERPDGREAYEQLWARWRSGMEFEVCSIPFFAYGIALGDRVQTDGDATFERVIERSGRRCIRIWRNDESVSQGEVERALIREGLLFEWHSARLVSVDLPSEGQFERLLLHLDPWRQSSAILTEDGA